MTGEGWPALDRILAAAPPRAPSVIVTVYGDAVLPRGGALALKDLLVLMRRLGATEGMVRTAVSRLARDGVLQGSRTGRHSAYGLTAAARDEFAAVIPRIYGEGSRDGTGRLLLAFPLPGTDRTALEAAGFAVLAPGVLAGTNDAPQGVPTVTADAVPETLQLLAERAWPLARLAVLYDEFLATFGALSEVAPSPLDAMTGRTLVIHAFRRIALRDPHLPLGLLPESWPGTLARSLFLDLYAALAPASERWLDNAGSGAGPLPGGPDPMDRFSGGGTRPSATAW